jgi:hypothetical protein
MADLVKDKILMVQNIIKNKGVLASILHKALLNFSSKSAVINYIFRNLGFTDSHGNVIVFPDSVIRMISQKVNVTIKAADQVITEFLLNTICFKRFLNCNNFSWNHDLAKLRRKLRIFLHKAYRIAPVFNYNRAIRNSEILINLMQRKFYFPRFTTQLALVIFVTDANNKNKLFDTPLLQKNIRVFCDCSAFAFHRARNRLRINSDGHVF